jgi:hypothetical protein
MSEEEIKKMFRRVEIDKSNDSCGFEFADGFDCTFDNIATCYDDRLKLYDLVKKLQQENNRLKEQYCERTDCVGRLGNSKKVERIENTIKELRSWLEFKIKHGTEDEQNACRGGSCAGGGTCCNHRNAVLCAR